MTHRLVVPGIMPATICWFPSLRISFTVEENKQTVAADIGGGALSGESPNDGNLNTCILVGRSRTLLVVQSWGEKILRNSNQQLQQLRITIVTTDHHSYHYHSKQISNTLFWDMTCRELCVWGWELWGSYLTFFHWNSLNENDIFKSEHQSKQIV